MSSTLADRIIDTEFWQLPLAERMALFAELREQGPFVEVSFEYPMMDLTEKFFAVTRYAEVVEISRRPQDFCSGKGSTSIIDMPPEALEFFGSLLSMAHPRH